MKQLLQQLLQLAIQSLREKKRLPKDIDINIQIERARDKQYGDFASNVAMMLSKPAGCKPRELAELIVANLPASDLIKETVIAGPGFINFFLSTKAFYGVVAEILQNKGVSRSTTTHKGKVNVEFVSANPTGPLHVGHGRGAAYGSAISNLLAAAGFNVHQEYYVNDAGRQMDILATSIWLRYLELYDAELCFPNNGYKGDYVNVIAKKLKEKAGDNLKRDVTEMFKGVPADATPDGAGDKEAHIDGLITNAKNLLKSDYNLVFDLGLNSILNDIRDDLHRFGVDFDEWFSERSLKESNAISHAIDKLRKSGHLYERDGATWFSSIPFGDDKDRVVIRENGQTTYFASDVAYLLNKFERGFDHVIYVFGADHHGYVQRLKAAAKALGLDENKVTILLVQFAVLYRGEEKIQMSTRSGSFVTLRQLREEVGRDAARFFYVLRKCEQHMDFDLDLAKSQSSDNPVYYIQYAHARICSVFRQLAERNLKWDKTSGINAFQMLQESHEKSLFAMLSRYQEVVLAAALNYEPHLLANYLRELATDLHTYYNAHHFIVDDHHLRNARLCLIAAVQQVIANGLKLLGLSAPERM